MNGLMISLGAGLVAAPGGEVDGGTRAVRHCGQMPNADLE